MLSDDTAMSMPEDSTCTGRSQTFPIRTKIRLFPHPNPSPLRKEGLKCGVLLPLFAKRRGAGG
jgi:hypothetical protein